MRHDQVYLGSFDGSLLVVRAKQPTPPTGKLGLGLGGDAFIRRRIAARHQVYHELEEWRQCAWNSPLFNDIAVQGVVMTFPVIDDACDARAYGVVWRWEWPTNPIDSLVCIISEAKISNVSL